MFQKNNPETPFFSVFPYFFYQIFFMNEKNSTFVAPGEMAEWSNAAVLKTVVPRGTGGSNPSLSASKSIRYFLWIFLLEYLLITF